MSRHSNRRDFLKSTTAAGVGFWVAAGARPPKASRPTSVSLRLHRRRRQGKQRFAGRQRAGDIVAICDIDDNTLGKRRRKVPKAKKFNDFRKMLEEIGGRTSTP